MMIIIYFLQLVLTFVYTNSIGSNESDLIFANYDLDIREVKIDEKYKKPVELNLTIKLRSIKKNYYVNDIDYIRKSNYIIWRNKTHILGSKMNETLDEEPQVLVITDSTTPAKLSYDWIHDLLYYTDKNSIVVFQIGNTFSKYNVITTDHKLDFIKDIAVDPYHFFLFWTQWDFNLLNPRIMRSDEDGSNITLLSNTDIKQPLLLTLDYQYNNIYWIDVTLFTLSSMSYDGKRRRTIIQSQPLFQFAVSMDMFNDYIYWVNSSQKSILYTNKYGINGNQSQTFMKSQSYIYAIHINGSSEFGPQDNKCNSSECTDLCLPSRKPPNYQCICFSNDSYDPIEGNKCNQTNLMETQINNNNKTSFYIIFISCLVSFVIFTLLALFMHFRYGGNFGSLIRKCDNSVTFTRVSCEDIREENIYDDIRLND